MIVLDTQSVVVLKSKTASVSQRFPKPGYESFWVVECNIIE
jgi:hypothetical protein